MADRKKHQFLNQETVRFDDEERARLNRIMDRAEKEARGRVLKADVMKELMGLAPYRTITAEDRASLLPELDDESGPTSRPTIKVRDKRSRVS